MPNMQQFVYLGIRSTVRYCLRVVAAASLMKTGREDWVSSSQTFNDIHLIMKHTRLAHSLGTHTWKLLKFENLPVCAIAEAGFEGVVADFFVVVLEGVSK